MGQDARAVFSSGGKTIAGGRSAPSPIGGSVTVNGKMISAAAIRAETQHHSAPKGKPAMAWTKAARALVIRTLLLQEADRRGLIADPAELEPGRFETDEEALIRQVLEDAADYAPPTEAAVCAEWERDPSRFRSPPLWEVSHILCACDPREDKARHKAMARARMLAERVHKAPRSFADIARRESDCGSSANGGALGQVGPGDSVPEFEAALRDLGDGDITSEPVLTRYGYHIIRMDARARGKALPFNAVRQSVRDALEKAAWSRAADDVVAQLVTSAQISGVTMQPD